MSACDIFKQIDDLGQGSGKSAAKLAAKLQPILSQLAYLCTIGEGASLEVREEWHSTFNNELRSEAGRSGAEAGPRASAGVEAGPRASASAAAPKPKKKKKPSRKLLPQQI